MSTADITTNDPIKNTNMYAQGELPTPQDDGNDPKNPYLAGHRPMEIWMQYLLQNALQSLAKLAADPSDTTIDRMFGFYPDEQRKALKTYLADTNIADHVTINFPKHEYDLPIVACHSREEKENEQHQLLGHEAIVVDRDAKTSSELVGQWLDGTMDLIVITDDPTTTMFLYRVAWYIVFSNKLELEKYVDMHNLIMSGGAINFDTQTFPNWQYSRIITLRYQTLFDHYLEDMQAPLAVRFSEFTVKTPSGEAKPLP